MNCTCRCTCPSNKTAKATRTKLGDIATVRHDATKARIHDGGIPMETGDRSRLIEQLESQSRYLQNELRRLRTEDANTAAAIEKIRKQKTDDLTNCPVVKTLAWAETSCLQCRDALWNTNANDNNCSFSGSPCTQLPSCGRLQLANEAHSGTQSKFAASHSEDVELERLRHRQSLLTHRIQALEKSKVNLQLSLNQLVQSEVGTATSSDYGCAGNGDMKASTQHFCVDNRETYDTIDKYQKVSPTTCMTDQECQTEFPMNAHAALDKKYLPTLNSATDSYPVTRLGNRLDRGHNIGSETEVSKRSVTTISALAAVAAVAAASYLSRSMHASSIDTSTPPIQWSLSNASKSVYVSSEKTRSEQEKNQQACTQSMIAGKPETNDAILQSSVFPMAAPCSTRTHSEVQRQPSFMNQRVPPIDGLQALENNYQNYSQCVGDGNLKLRILCNAPQTDVDECIPQINGQQSLAYSWHESFLNPPNSPRPSTKFNLLAPPTLSRTDYQPRTRFAQRIEIARQAINDQAVTPVTHHMLWGRRGFSQRSPPPATDSSTDEGHCVEQYMRPNSVVFNAKDEVACNVPQDVKTMSRIVVMEEKCYSEDDNSETDGTRLDRVHSRHPTSAQTSKLAHHKLNHSRSTVLEKESQSDSGASLGSEGAQTQSDEVTPQGMRQPKSVLISGYSKQRKNDKNSGIHRSVMWVDELYNDSSPCTSDGKQDSAIGISLSNSKHASGSNVPDKTAETYGYCVVKEKCHDAGSSAKSHSKMDCDGSACTIESTPFGRDMPSMYTSKRTLPNTTRS